MALPLLYNMRNLRVRFRVTLLAVVGVAVVVAVVVTLLAMRNGFATALRATGRADNGIVIQRGSGGAELMSGVSSEQARLIAVDARVARGSDGEPLASPEIVVVVNLKRREDGQPTNVTLRGVTPRAFEVRSGIRVVRGRAFQPGLDEVIVGERIQERIAGLDLGSRVRLQKRAFEVVGVFASEGSAFESEMWSDKDALAAAFQRQGGYQSVTVRLADPAALAAFDADLGANPQMDLEMKPERTYYADQAGPVAGALLVLASFVSVVMGVGAVFGAMNTMYAIVAARTREVGTLRALGFSRGSVLVGFLLESVLLALLGGLLGCLLALPFNGFTTATGNNASFAELAFAFRVTGRDLAMGLVFAAVMGVLGGLLPALRAARLPITQALRET